MTLRKMIAAAIVALPSLALAAQENPAGTVTYALPQTVLSFEVEALRESFFAGPYAKYAQKYLGIDAREQDAVTYQLTSVKMTPCIEADQSSRHTVVLPAKSSQTFLQMTSQGLISTSDGRFGEESAWRFPVSTGGDFSTKGVNSNFTSEAATLYRSVKADSVYNKVSVSQNVVVSKSLEQKAKEAADMILKLRKTRVQIVTGDTDASYSGEAMAAAISEIARLESEYLSLFIGYSEYQTQKMKCDLVPVNNSRGHVFVAFRLSDSQGLVSADNMSGKPYLIDIASEGIESDYNEARGAAKGAALLYYRIPSICTVKLTDGVNILLQTRIPIYQFGVTNTIPLSSK